MNPQQNSLNPNIKQDLNSPEQIPQINQQEVMKQLDYKK